MEVYYEQNDEGGRRPPVLCRPIPFRKEFDWNGFTWIIGGVYVWEEGIIFDLCKRVPLPMIKAYLEKWESHAEDEAFMHRKGTAVEAENPCSTDMHLDIVINGEETEHFGSWSYSWALGCLETVGINPTPEQIMDEYKLDPAYGWTFMRVTSRWKFIEIPKHIEVCLKFTPEVQKLPCGETFKTSSADIGKVVSFSHPLTGEVYELTIDGIGQDTMDEEFFKGALKGYPRHFQWMDYHFSSPVLSGICSIRDSEPSDLPKGKRSGACAFSVIGKRDGQKDGVSEVISRLKYEPVMETDWQIEIDTLQGEGKELLLSLF